MTNMRILISKAAMTSNWSPATTCHNDLNNGTNWDLFYCVIYWLGKFLEVIRMQQDEFDFIMRLAYNCETDKRIVLREMLEDEFRCAIATTKAHCDVFLFSSSECQSALTYLLTGLPLTSKYDEKRTHGWEDLDEPVEKLDEESTLKIIQDFLSLPIDEKKVSDVCLTKLVSWPKEKPMIYQMLTELATSTRKLYDKVFED
jgi:hypothetical protein